jgi:hypothetical protein
LWAVYENSHESVEGEAMKRIAILLPGIWFWCALGITAQEAVVAPPESLVLDGVPKIPASLAETAERYGEYRSASLADWQPGKRGLLISTRFAATPQLHLVGQPGGYQKKANQDYQFYATVEFLEEYLLK